MEYQSYAALIISSEAEEFSVKNLYESWEPITVSGDEQMYFQTEFLRDSRPCRVIYARQRQSGIAAATALSGKLIQNFRPRYLMNLGAAACLAAGDMEQQMCGEVLAADIVFHCSCGTFVPAEHGSIRVGPLGFRPESFSILTDQGLRPYLEAAIDSPENQNQVHLGPIASGPSLSANAEVLLKRICSTYSCSAGLDMDAYGVAYAAQDASMPRPTALVIKGICDYTDSRKSEQQQKYAAMNSAEFAQLLYEKFLPIA